MAPNLLPMFVSLVFVTLLCQADCQNFNRHPESGTVDEGSNVTLTCESLYATECAKTYYFRWYRDPDEYVADCYSVQEDLQGRMTVRLDTQNRRYQLTIRNVQLEDSGDYWCTLVFTSQSQTNELARATLSVNQVLPRVKPSCELDPPQPTVNTTVQLKCTLSPNDPPNVMAWFESPLIERNQLERGREIQPGEVYSVERVLTKTDNMKEFTCVAGPNIGGPNCSITPLQIPTIASIFPSSITLQEHQSALFTCDLEATPPQIANEYKWRVSKNNGSRVKINQDTLDDYNGQYKLGPQGKTLIVNGSLGDFNNSKIRCIAYYNGIPYPSNDSLLTVLLAPDQSLPTTVITRATSTNGPNSDNNTSNGSETVIIVGGVLGVICFLIIIVLLGCYLVKTKRNVKRPGQMVNNCAHKPSTEERVTITAVEQIGPTYEQIPVDNGVQNRRTCTSLDDLAHAEAVCSFPEETRRDEIKRYVVSSSSTSGKMDSTDGECGAANGHAIYAMPNKGLKTHPTSSGQNGDTRPESDVNETAVPDAGDIAPQQTNVEGLVYADLNLERPPSASQKVSLHSFEQTEYAEIRRDM